MRFEGKEIQGRPGHEVVSLGIAQSPEGRKIFGRMSVAENLELGAFRAQRPRRPSRTDLERVLELFPRLRERIDQRAGTMSGGEQQMLAIGRALMARPRLLMLDEPSLGLAPVLVDLILETVVNINREGTTILIVEQNALAALSHRRTTPTCWSRAASSWTARRPSSRRTTRCARRTSAAPDRRAGYVSGPATSRRAAPSAARRCARRRVRGARAAPGEGHVDDVALAVDAGDGAQVGARQLRAAVALHDLVAGLERGGGLLVERHHPNVATRLRGARRHPARRRRPGDAAVTRGP